MAGKDSDPTFCVESDSDAEPEENRQRESLLDQNLRVKNTPPKNFRRGSRLRVSDRLVFNVPNSRSVSNLDSAGVVLTPNTLGIQTREVSRSTPIMSAYERFDNSKGSIPSIAVATASGSTTTVLSDQSDDADTIDVRIKMPPAGGAVTFMGRDEPEFISDPGALVDPNAVTAITKMKEKIRRILEHIAFRLFTVLLILTDLLLVCIDLSVTNCVSASNVLEIISHIIITFFVLEVSLRIFAKGRAFFYVILDVIDMAVIILSFIVDMAFLALSPEQCDDKDLDDTAFARLIVIGRAVRIIRIVRIIYFAYNQRRHVTTATRQLVSQNKRRYQKDGFDLDLCYITERVIAMSFPSKGLMAVYRNPVEEVARFFKAKHKDHFRIYNLCSERDYDESLFDHRVERIYIDDHNVPKAREMLHFAENASQFMAEDPENVIAIHCKGGKGRTGTMICVWLIESGLFEEAKECLAYFGDRRTDLSKGQTFQGVETPSQSRYVGYFEEMKSVYDHNLPPKQLLEIKSLTVTGISSVGHGDGSDLFLEIREDNIPFYECNLGTEHNCEVTNKPDTDSIVVQLKNIRAVDGDIKVMFKTHNKQIPIGYDKCPFYFWFNTRFIEHNQLKLSREELDNPHKPKTHKTFHENFAVTVDFKPAVEQ